MRNSHSLSSLSGVALCFAMVLSATAQQQVTPVQPTGQRPLPARVQAPVQQPLAQQVQGQAAPLGQQQGAAAEQPPEGFHLNALQMAHLDQVLNAWQTKSATIDTFRCAFERWEYNAFSPKVNNQEAPLNKSSGELSYSRPDKGSFQIKEIRTFRTTPPTAGEAANAPVKGDWVKDSNAIGEHWVCDGKSIFEYRHHDKQLVERPIPPQLQGQAIVDGPLPFLFGAEAEKLKARYWLRVEEHKNPNEIFLTAKPRFLAQAADFSKVEVILDRQALLPRYMQVHLPDRSRHMYIFDISNASVNAPFAALQQFFQRPTMWPGWKRVVEQMPMDQAAIPQPAPK